MRSVKAKKSSRRAARTNSVRRGPSNPRPPVERIVLGKRTAARENFFVRFARTVARPIPLGRPMLLLTGLLLVGSLVAAIGAGGYVSRAENAVKVAADEVLAYAGFKISAVHLSGNARTSPAAIIDALGFEPDQSIFGADIQGARARLMALDWVADAEVRRQYPNSISVSIIEKLPFALWQSANGLVVVERSGAVITKAKATDFPHLPLFLGDGAPQTGAELVDAIASHRAISARLRAMERVSDRRWNLLLDDGVIVELPETGWAKQLDELEHLIVDKGVLERDISEIDLRSPDNYFFELRNGDKQQTTRGNAT